MRLALRILPSGNQSSEYFPFGKTRLVQTQGAGVSKRAAD
jgi:hypothetical protein